MADSGAPNPLYIVGAIGVVMAGLVAWWSLSPGEEAPSPAPVAQAPAASEAKATAEAAPEEEAQEASPAREVSPEVLAAIGLVDDKDHAAAVEQLTAYLESSSEDPDAWFWRGRANLGLKQHEAAVSDFAKARSLDEAFKDAWTWQAFALVVQKRCEDAIPILTGMTESWPEDPDPWFNRGHCSYTLKDFKGAHADSTRACELGHKKACLTARKVAWSAQKMGSPLEGVKLQSAEPTDANGQAGGAPSGGKP